MSYCSAFFAPVADLAGGQYASRAVRIAQQDRRCIVGADVARFGRAFGGGEGFHRTQRLLPFRHKRRQFRQNRTGALAADKAGQVQPMGADVANRAQGAALIRLQPPVPVGRFGQLILMIPPGNQPDIAQFAIRRQAVGLLVQGVEAGVVADSGNAARRLGQCGHFRRLRRSHGERFFTNYMPHGCPYLLHLRIVRYVGRSDMDDLHRRIGQQFLQRGIGPRHAQGRCPFRPTFGAGPQNARHLDVKTPQRLDMHRADKAGADDGSADLAGVMKSNSLRLLPDGAGHKGGMGRI